MIRRSMISLLCLLCLGVALGARAAENSAPAAENQGQADLDKATQIKLGATTLAELSDVIQLCERALSKGLDASNTQFANELLASTLVQRGSEYAGKAARDGEQGERWQEDRKAALADLEKGLKLNAKQAQAWFLVARLNLLPEGDAKRAAEALDETIKLTADEPLVRAEALILRGKEQTDPLKKLADLDEAVSVAPGSAGVWRARGAARADSGKLDQAIEDLNKAIELEPKSPGTYLLKGMVLSKQKKYDEAISVLDAAIKLAPKSLELLLQKARIYTLQSNFKAAIEELGKALVIDPNNIGVLMLRAGVHQEMGEKDKALADVDQILKLKPGLNTVMRDRALLLADMGKFEEALGQMESLRQADPKDELTLLQLGMLYSSQKKPDKAIEVFSALLVDHPDNWMALRGRADCYLNLGRRAEAIADYDKAQRLQPKNPTILNNLAWVLATAPEKDLRDGKRAVNLATEACKATEYKEAYILSTLAAAYAESGDFASAVKWSTKAVEMSSKEKEHGESLKRELESYKAGKPFRENLPDDKKP